MKNFLTYARLAVTAGAVLCLPIAALLAAETNAPIAGANAAQAAAMTSPAPADRSTGVAKLPYGVEEVLKLTRANISDDITINYIQSSGTIYNLTAQDIVYMRNQGVSDRVLNAMVGQRKLVEATAQAQQQVAPAVPNAPTVPDANVAPAAPLYPDSGQAYVEPPATPAPSSVYVIPSSQVGAAYYGYYGYPYSYYSPYYCGGYWGPSVGIGIGFGGYYHGYGHYGRGYYGHGGYHGGHGWHR